MISKKNIPFLLLTSASMAVAAGCRTTMDQDVAQSGSSTLTANIGGVTPDSRGELEKGEFKLWCDNKTSAIATAKMAGEKVDFKLAQGVTVAAGDRCYVNVMRPDLGENANVSFPLGAGIYWGSSKSTVFTENQSLAIKLDLFKAYSAKDGSIGSGSGAKTLNFVMQLNNGKGPVVASGVLNVKCENETETLVGRGVIDGGVVKTAISAAAKFVNMKCDLKFTTDMERDDYASEAKLTLAETNGSATAPVVLRKAVNDVGVVAAIDLKGDCRVFSSDRSSCQWVMPDSCKLPMGEVAGDYDHIKWLTCVADAATVTNRMLSAGVPQQQGSASSQNRVTAQRIVQEMQNAARSWNQKQSHERPALIETLLGEGQRVTASSGKEPLNVRDNAVVYGLEKVILPVLNEVKSNLSKGQQ